MIFKWITGVVFFKQDADNGITGFRFDELQFRVCPDEPGKNREDRCAGFILRGGNTQQAGNGLLLVFKPEFRLVGHNTAARG
jgi:hypothetical protein